MLKASDLAAVGVLDVSRETLFRLDDYRKLVEKWNRSINLVSSSTLEEFNHRHILDCAQLSPLAGHARSWVDLGAGAGLPGLVISILRRKDSHEFQMTVVESDERKCVFMMEAARTLDLDVIVRNDRIEDKPSQLYDVVSARALAPLKNLVEWGLPYLSHGGCCLFPKGAYARDELTDTELGATLSARLIPSRTRKDSSIVQLYEALIEPSGGSKPVSPG